MPKRYRNRRLGDFLKELKLTEGHATGLPAIKKVMEQNGSPKPLFDFDEERTWFQVTLPIHVAFEPRQPVEIDLQGIKWNLETIDKILHELIEKTGTHEMTGIDGSKDDTIANTIAEFLKTADNQAIETIEQTDSTIVSTIADTIANLINIKENIVLNLAKLPVDRKTMLNAIGLKNLRHNYDAHVKHLEEKGWLTMTIPNKPTSPKQQYLTTLKGRLILQLLRYGKK